ncbi:universal stress protein [Natrinema sp. DC36]|uniref:universal stress protein n=1 Tax=Natrinema sp. DC36 TaxID=2878680 RepID=UPI001CF0A93B|nr:universal stress protein [Natrinema sp. DC36]
MYRIVIAVDTDEERAMQAVDYVTGLVDDGLIENPDEVAVTICNVFEEFTAVDDGGRVSSDELFDPDNLPDAVVTVHEALEAAGLDVEVVRRHGDAAAEIVDCADSRNADVLVVPTRERSPVGKAIFGSVTQEVILETDRPVTVL